MRGASHLLGVISDTHGLVRTEAVHALNGAELIIHAGDIGSPDVISQLETVAPVKAIRGNNDRELWAQAFPETQMVEVGGVSIYVLHNLDELDLDAKAAGFDVLIFGHSHRPLAERRGGVLYLNPGSAGPRRFDLPVSVARLRVSRNSIKAELVHLRVPAGVRGSAAAAKADSSRWRLR